MKQQHWFMLASTMGLALALILFNGPLARGQSQSGAAAVNDQSGLTVLGYGDATAKADLVHVILTVNTANTTYGPTGPTFEAVDEKGVGQVVAALAANGIATDTVEVNLYGRAGFYGPGGPGSTLEFSYGEPANLNDFLGKVQAKLKEDRGPAIQQAAAVYLVKDCQSLEAQAWAAALSNAKARAEAAAKLMEVKLGALQGVTEKSGNNTYGLLPGGCAALEAAQHAGDLNGFLSNRQNTANKVEMTINLEATYAMTR